MFVWNVKWQKAHSDRPTPEEKDFSTKDEAMRAVMNMVIGEDKSNPLVFLCITRMNG